MKLPSPFPTRTEMTGQGEEVTRRRFLTTLASVTAATASGVSLIPKVAQAADASEIEKAIQLYYNRCTTGSLLVGANGLTSVDDPVLLNIIRQLVENRPGYLLDPIRDEELKPDAPFTVVSRAMPISYTMEIAQDLKLVHGAVKAEEMIMNTIVLGWIETMDEWMAQHDTKIRFFVPIQMIRAVDFKSHISLIGFKTRYAEIVRT